MRLFRHFRVIIYLPENYYSSRLYYSQHNLTKIWHNSPWFIRQFGFNNDNQSHSIDMCRVRNCRARPSLESLLAAPETVYEFYIGPWTKVSARARCWAGVRSATPGLVRYILSHASLSVSPRCSNAFPTFVSLHSCHARNHNRYVVWNRDTINARV